MKTTTIDGYSSRPSLREIAPETPGAAREFIGLGAAYVGGFVGEAAAAEVYRIEHECLDHGLHHRWLYGQNWYTPAGLVRIIDELWLRGHVPAALALRRHVEHKAASLRRASANEMRWDLRTEALA
jgi:hypothetical protein